MTGGYSLIDCFDVNITSDPVKIEGIFKKYQMSKRKAFLLSNVTINNTQLNDVFSTPYFEDGKVCFPAYDGVIKISDTDYVTFEATADVIADKYLSKEDFLTIESDNTPYVSRTARDGLVKMKLVGGTVAWNQLVQNGNFADGTDNWNTLSSETDISASDNVLTITKSINAADGPYYAGDCIVNHVYLCFANAKKVSGDPFGIRFLGETSGDIVIDSENWTTAIKLIKATESVSDVKVAYFRYPTGNRGTGNVRNVHIHDITQMFGTTIADYVYSLEQSVEGSGIAWLKSYGFFTKDYYAYDAGSLQSVCTSGRKITALDGTVRSYPIDNEELRGLFKLDANNKLYADGDVYPSSGSGTRKYALLTEQSGAIGDTITLTGAKEDTTNIISTKGALSDIGTISGTTLTLTVALSNDSILYELATETTFSADPYINPQRSEGTEEFVDGLTRDVMIPVGNNSTYYLSEVLPSAADYTDGQVAGLESSLADTDNMIAPAWSATATYTNNSIVRYGGKLYKAISNVPANTLPTDVTYWVEDIISNDIKTYLDSEPAILKRIPFTLNGGTTKTIELNRLTRAVLIMIGSSENFNNIFLINTTTQSAISYRKVFSTDNFSINVEEANLFKITNTDATYSALGYLIVMSGSGTILS